MMTRHWLLLVLLGLLLLARLSSTHLVEDEEFDHGEFHDDEEEEIEFAENIVDSKLLVKAHDPKTKANVEPRAGRAAAEEDEEDEYFDEEEFEGFATIQKTVKREATTDKTGNKAASSSAAAAAAATPKSAALADKNYFIELAFVLVMLAYAINFLLGRQHNEKLARSWLIKYQPFFSSQFIHLGQLSATDLEAYRSGHQREKTKKRTILFEKISQSEFRFTATGRRNCLGMQATLNTIKRQDLLTTVYNLIVPQQDKILIELPLQLDGPSFVFFLAKTNLVKSLVAQYKDIPNFSRQQPALNKTFSGFTVQSDVSDTAALILSDQRIARAVRDGAQDLQFIHLTDHSVGIQGITKILRVGMRLPSADRIDRIEELMEMVFNLLDLVCQVNLTAADKTFQAKIHSVANKLQSKAELEQRKDQIEKLAAEKREAEKKRYESLTPGEQEKYDLKKQRREAKKRQGKTKMVMMG